MMEKLDKSKVKYIVVHCSATYPGQRCDAEIIDTWHRQRGYAMIGYHYVVMPDGEVQHGRPLFYQGAHAKGYNHCSVGVCYVGGLNADGETADTRTEEQKKAMMMLLMNLKKTFPQARIVGHRELDMGKACPCFDATVYNRLIEQENADRTAYPPTTNLLTLKTPTNHAHQ